MFIQKKGVISGVCLVLFFTVFLNGFTQSVLPEGYPKLIDTGNPERDAAEYEAIKRAWISAHPDEYNKINNVSTTIAIPEKEANVTAPVTTVGYDINREERKEQITLSPKEETGGAIIRSQIVFTERQYELLSPEKKEAMKNNPQKYPHRIIPNILIPRVEFLLLPEEERQMAGKYEITDLITKESIPVAQEGVIYISESEFYRYGFQQQSDILKSDKVVILSDDVGKRKYIITGEKFLLLDAVSQRRVLSNPEEVEVIKTGIHQSEFDKMSLEKQTIILSHPDFFIIVKE